MGGVEDEDPGLSPRHSGQVAGVLHGQGVDDGLAPTPLRLGDVGNHLTYNLENRERVFNLLLSVLDFKKGRKEHFKHSVRSFFLIWLFVTLGYLSNAYNLPTYSKSVSKAISLKEGSRILQELQIRCSTFKWLTHSKR